MKNIVLFGPPGAGKGTQAEFLKTKFNLFHISTGDVFRFNSTPLGLMAKSFMDKGHLVPDEVTINMLNEVVRNNLESNGFIFDGFPRTNNQAEALDVLMEENDSNISAMIALEVDDEILISRLLERGKTSGRVDDSTKNIIQNRISEYYKKTAILKNFYMKKNRYFGVNGEGNVKVITERLSSVIESL